MTLCQLAARYSPGRTRYPVRVEVKIDGMRCVAVKRGGAVTLLSREGGELTVLPGIVAALTVAPIDNVVLDAELAPSADDLDPSPTMWLGTRWLGTRPTLHVFDALPLDVWDSRGTSVPLGARLVDVARLVQDIGAPCVVAVEGRTVESEAELDALYRETIARGAEGLVVKRLDAPYRWGRSVDWRKRKPGETE